MSITRTPNFLVLPFFVAAKKMKLPLGNPNDFDFAFEY
jgi:hypothetical protein